MLIRFLILSLNLKLFVSSCFVRPLSLTNGEKHPLAEVERMECPTPAFTDNDRVYIVRICGDLFGLIVREPHLVGEQSDDRLVVRNWKTGDTILVRVSHSES